MVHVADCQSAFCKKLNQLFNFRWKILASNRFVNYRIVISLGSLAEVDRESSSAINIQLHLPQIRLIISCYCLVLNSHRATASPRYSLTAPSPFSSRSAVVCINIAHSSQLFTRIYNEYNRAKSIIYTSDMMMRKAHELRV